MTFRFTEEDFKRYVKQTEHDGRHIWHELQDQLEALFGVPFSAAPYIARGDRLRTLWFAPKETPRSVWANQAQFFLARSIEEKQLSFGLMVECASPSEVTQYGQAPDQDGPRLVECLESDSEFTRQLDQLVSQIGWGLGVNEWNKDWHSPRNSVELLDVLKRMPEEQGWGVHIQQVMTADEAIAAGEDIVNQIMDAYKVVRPLWKAVIPEADREYLGGAGPPVEKSNRDSEAYARQVIESLLPDPESRRTCLNLMADYIVQAHRHSPATWEVTLFSDKVRLNVGSIQTYVILPDEIYLVTDANSLTDQDRVTLAQQGEVSLQTYDSVSDTYDIQLPAQSLSTILPVVQKSYAPLIERAFEGGKRTPYYKSHSPGVIKYMRSFLGRQDIPDPDYGTSPPPPPSFDLRAALANSLSAQGLMFTPWQIATFYTALQTKGFVILSGISGTGKTKLAQAFAALLPRPESIALLGVADPIKDQQLYGDREIFAYWWSYPIRDDVVARLPLPFRLYIYHQEQITHVYSVTEFQAQPGDDGMESPWSDITLPEEAGRTAPDDHPNWKFKTWCKITRMTKLDRSIDLTSIRPLFGYSQHPSALRNALMPIEDPQVEPLNWIFCPVRPDWRDSKSLLGYYNPLTGTYEWTLFLRFLLRAVQSYRTEDGFAWFVILDEMNLAHVEYYFADLLSVLESGRGSNGWTREPLRLAYPDDAEGNLPPRELRLPPNLYVVGTVNVDETTHAFSPKVLDRAFTLELTEADFRAYPPQGTSAVILTDAERQALLKQFSRDGKFALVEKAVIAAYITTHPEIRNRLQTLNDLLHPYNLHFGYRVFDEIVAFLAAAEENDLYANLGGMEAAFDAAVLMKILPKFHGSRGKLERPLQAILAWCVNPEIPDLASVRQELERIDSTADLEPVWGKLTFRLSSTARRVQRMMGSLYTTGFAAFG